MLKRIVSGIIFMVLLVGMLTSAFHIHLVRAETNKTLYFHFRGAIDGGDYLCIQRDLVWIEHERCWYPGMPYEGLWNLSIYINGEDWWPTWTPPPSTFQDEPDPISNPEYFEGGISEKHTYQAIDGYQPERDINVTLEVIDWPVELGGEVSMEQYPVKWNNYTTKVYLNDYPPQGWYWYEFLLYYEEVPSLTANFTWSPPTSKVGEFVTFDASSSSPGWNGTHEMPITEYHWDFGDGNKTTTSTPIVCHSFSSARNYYVTLTVYAPGSIPETNSTIHKITVISVPVGGYSFSIKKYTTAKPLTPYIAVVAILTLVFTVIRRKVLSKTEYQRKT